MGRAGSALFGGAFEPRGFGKVVAMAVRIESVYALTPDEARNGPFDSVFFGTN